MTGVLRIRMRNGGEHVLVGAVRDEALRLIRRWRNGHVQTACLDAPAGPVVVDLREAESIEFVEN